ncbi:sporulation-specific protein Spo7p [Trichomonascus vanleenenianus]|uniref:Nem1-Spo7 phosphatase regulatory subunit SPO7 n=1 Tax=Trichomonascus vanleenenianus TaxID=2268995 RepID=UPI003ECB501E
MAVEEDLSKPLQQQQEKEEDAVDVSSLEAPPVPSSPSRVVKKRRGTHSHSRSRNELLETLPARSPAQIFRNLLALEQSLRIQYTEVAQSRRKHLLFFCVLLTAIAYFHYSVFFSPSIYRLFSFLNKVGLVTTVIIMGLFYLTGLYHKTFVDYPRFLHTTNKGLRPFNVKLVRVHRTWRESLIALIWDPAYSCREGGLVKIVLSPRSFSTETIEGWEIYRQEYWEREYNRRLRRKLNPAPKRVAKPVK